MKMGAIKEGMEVAVYVDMARHIDGREKHGENITRLSTHPQSSWNPGTTYRRDSSIVRGVVEEVKCPRWYQVASSYNVYRAKPDGVLVRLDDGSGFVASARQVVSPWEERQSEIDAAAEAERRWRANADQFAPMLAAFVAAVETKLGIKLEQHRDGSGLFSPGLSIGLSAFEGRPTGFKPYDIHMTFDLLSKLIGVDVKQSA